MLFSDVVASPIAILLLALAIGYIIWYWSRTVAPPFRAGPDRTLPYVGGEALPAQVYKPGYIFFYVALFFAIVHVAALVLATAPANAPLWGTLGYLAIVAVAVAMLRWEQ